MNEKNAKKYYFCGKSYLGNFKIDTFHISVLLTKIKIKHHSLANHNCSLSKF